MLTPTSLREENRKQIGGLSREILAWDRFVRLVSLLEVLKTYAHIFADLLLRMSACSIAIAQLDSSFKRSNPNAEFDVANIETVGDGITEDLQHAEKLDLRSAHEHVARLLDDKPWKGIGFAYDLKQAVSRITDDLKSVWFMLVPLSKVEYFDKPYFGEKTEARFQDAVDDMREAGSCFALGRWTGVVHHCMGVVQEGMIELGKDLGASLDEYLHDWNDMEAHLQNAITAKRAAILSGSKAKASNADKSRWAKLEPFYSEVLSDVRDMKKAWRNPGFHFRLPPFDEAKAKKVLDKVRDFMTNLAENI